MEKLGSLGCWVTIVLYCFMLLFADRTALLTAGVITVVCIVFYYAFTKRHSAPMLSMEEEIGVLEEPSVEEKTRMDREYAIWKYATIAVTLLALGIYFIPMLLP